MKKHFTRDLPDLPILVRCAVYLLTIIGWDWNSECAFFWFPLTIGFRMMDPLSNIYWRWIVYTSFDSAFFFLQWINCVSFTFHWQNWPLRCIYIWIFLLLARFLDRNSYQTGRVIFSNAYDPKVKSNKKPRKSWNSQITIWRTNFLFT